MRPQQYRRVKESEDEDEEPRTLSTSSTCILPCILLILILLSLSLALVFFLHPWTPKILTTKPPVTRTTTTLTSTTLAPIGDKSDQNMTETGDFSFNGTGSGNRTLNGNGTLDDDDMLHESDSELKNHLISLIRKSEKFLEKLTGMEGELLVPVFMLLCFLSSVSIVSLCCCIMTKRREARRRQLFGKIITDLQTGDSKTVLLNHSDLDD